MRELCHVPDAKTFSPEKMQLCSSLTAVFCSSALLLSFLLTRSPRISAGCLCCSHTKGRSACNTVCSRLGGRFIIMSKTTCATCRCCRSHTEREGSGLKSCCRYLRCRFCFFYRPPEAKKKRPGSCSWPSIQYLGVVSLELVALIFGEQINSSVK